MARAILLASGCGWALDDALQPALGGLAAVEVNPSMAKGGRFR
jgi:hypothetical protein